MNFLYSLLLLLAAGAVQAQSLTGAWELQQQDSSGRLLRNVVIFADGFQVSAWFDSETGAFVSTNGGKWVLRKDSLTETVEFDTEQPERVGRTITFPVKIEGNRLTAGDEERVWQRIDAGEPGALPGAWLITGRMRDGSMQAMDTTRSRKTMKVLSGTRFQWIAYDTATSAFMGTGGGTYTTRDGIYTENIEFFSRDDSRVGAKLDFNYSLEENNWHHSGKSSRGQPIYEVWSIRKP